MPGGQKLKDSCLKSWHSWGIYDLGQTGSSYGRNIARHVEQDSIPFPVPNIGGAPEIWEAIFYFDHKLLRWKCSSQKTMVRGLSSPTQGTASLSTEKQRMDT